MKPREYYEKNWRKLIENEIPRVGDAWFPGGFCGGVCKPKVLDESDSFDPVGLQDNSIYRSKKIADVVMFDRKHKVSV